jgi:hypothetical protein
VFYSTGPQGAQAGQTKLPQKWKSFRHSDFRPATRSTDIRWCWFALLLCVDHRRTTSTMTEIGNGAFRATCPPPGRSGRFAQWFFYLNATLAASAAAPEANSFPSPVPDPIGRYPWTPCKAAAPRLPSDNAQASAQRSSFTPRIDATCLASITSPAHVCSGNVSGKRGHQ